MELPVLNQYFDTVIGNNGLLRTNGGFCASRHCKQLLVTAQVSFSQQFFLSTLKMSLKWLSVRAVCLF